ncbi:hypothetical protein KI387_017608, partial [Taxus chinensis]
FVCRTAAVPVYRVKNQRCRVLAFRDVTKKDDSNGTEDPESETPQISLSSDWRGVKETKQSSSRTLWGFPGWFSELHKQNLFLRSNEILPKPISRLKFFEGDQIVKELLADKVSHRIVKLWQNSEVWIKWPLAIFLPCFFAVTVLYGNEISSELTPLWIIGPLAMGTFIKLSLVASHLCVRLAINTVVIGMATPGKCMEAMHNCIRAVQLYKQNLVTKRDELISCVRSGEYKEIWWQKFKEYKERKTDEYYDILDFWWPKWRFVERFVKKLL